MFREIRTREFLNHTEKKEEGYKKIKPMVDYSDEEIENMMTEIFRQAAEEAAMGSAQ